MDVHPIKNGIFIGIDPYPFHIPWIYSMSGRIFRAGGRDFNRKICLVPHKSPMCRRCAFHCSNGVRQKRWRIGQSVKTSVHSYINHRISFKLSIHISLAQATISAQDQEIQSVKSRCFKATHSIFQAPWSTATVSHPTKTKVTKKNNSIHE